MNDGVPKKPFCPDQLLGKALFSFTKAFVAHLKKKFEIDVDSHGRITDVRKKVDRKHVYGERALKKNACGWAAKLPVLVLGRPGSRHWSEKDLEDGRWSLDLSVYTEKLTATGTDVSIFNSNGTLCDRAEGIRKDELRKLRRWMQAAGIRPLLWSHDELEAAPDHGWEGYAITKTPEGFYSICITARGGTPLSERQIYASPYPVQLIGLLLPELRKLRRQMKSVGLEEVASSGGNPHARALSTSTVRVRRVVKGRLARAGEALATDTYHHRVDEKGRHRISLPELQLEYEPMRLKGALELISRMKKDGLKPTANSVPQDDYQGAEP